MSDVKFDEINPIIGKHLDSFFPQSNCFIDVNPGHVYLPRKYVEIGEDIRNLPVFNDDIWLVSYPRTDKHVCVGFFEGSTWAQEMVWLLGNNLNFEGAKEIQLIRVPIIELTALFSENHLEWVSNSLGNSVDCIKNLKSPRFIRSHLPWQLLPKELEIVKPKIIYTARNPKDLCISLYHHFRHVYGLKGSLDDFCELFIADRTPLGSYWKHVLPFWERRNESNVLFLKYEDMRRDFRSTIKQCAKFLNFDYDLSEDDITRMCEYLKFDNMKINPAVNLEPIVSGTQEKINGENDGKENGNDDNKFFIRKGQIGDWKNHLSENLSRKFDEWIETNTKGTGLLFDYE